MDLRHLSIDTRWMAWCQVFGEKAFIALPFFRGMGQVMLQESALTGMLFFVGIICHSRVMAFGALIGLLTSNLAASALKYDREEIKKGLYGFNGALVGIALCCFFKLNMALIGLIVAGSFLTSPVMKWMFDRGWVPYTSPFLLVTWAFYFFIKLFRWIPLNALLPAQGNELDWSTSLFLGFGQVLFQPDLITGIIFALAVLIHSRISALFAFWGALGGMLTALCLSYPLGMVNSGLYGFNGVLCGIVFSGLRSKAWLFASLSIVLSVLMMNAMTRLHMIALTGPFVFSTWLVMSLPALSGKFGRMRKLHRMQK